MDLQWTGDTVAGARVYAAAAYALAFSSLLAANGLGLLCSLGLRETYCRPLDTDGPTQGTGVRD